MQASAMAAQPVILLPTHQVHSQWHNIALPSFNAPWGWLIGVIIISRQSSIPVLQKIAMLQGSFVMHTHGINAIF
jgi:hypothetical protein